MSNKVYIASSLDGYIADKNGGVDWLPSPNGKDDFGYGKFMDSIDALVMGRNTFQTVLSFDGEWFYTKKVFVISNTLKTIPENLKDKVELIQGTPKELVSKLNDKGYNNLYIDGSKTIQGFLKDDLIDELTITTVPVLLGGGVSLFGSLETQINFKHKETKVLDGMVQSFYTKRL